MNDHQIFILAAGSNKYAKKPCSLWSFNNGKSILDWQISSLERALPGSRIETIIGYDYKRIVKRYPNLNFSYALNWENSSSLDTLLNSKYDCREPLIAMYGDTVFRPEALTNFSEAEGDVVIAIDSNWQSRFEGRSQEDINIAETLDISSYKNVEYTGLIKLSPNVLKSLEFIKGTSSGLSSSNFLELLEEIAELGFTITPFDISGSWAEMNEPNDLVHFILGNKSETLSRIQPQLTKSKICDQITCSWHEWLSNPDKVVLEIQNEFSNTNIVVRSSSSDEDSWETANAGVFESILDIDCKDRDAVKKAINDVFLSYGSPSDGSIVLVQPFISEVSMSGVIFTCDLDTGAPYYVINYDDTSGRTDSITSGQKCDLRTIISFKKSVDAVQKIDQRIIPVIEAAKELEDILGFSKLDVEFAVDKSGQVYTFQVRPIVVKHNSEHVNAKQLKNILSSAQKQFSRWQTPGPHILGDYTVFSGMTDWNPVEIIGNRPNALAASLYSNIITEDVWAKQRYEFGYRDVRPSPLVHYFCSQPYVDCRASINSFIPASIPEELAKKLADSYLNLLTENPNLHDKLELDVVFTIWTPSFIKEANKRFKDKDISIDEIEILETSLKNITSQALVRLDFDILYVEELRAKINDTSLSEMSEIEKIYKLIDDCKQYGTLAFSHAARAGFVSITLLKSLVDEGLLSKERMLEFQASVPTVASDMQSALSSEETDLSSLVDDYGHLRPGTYDINQPAYWENPSFYLNRQMPVAEAENENDTFSFTKREKEEFQKILKALNSNRTIDEFIDYLAEAIQAREWVKFEFSRALSKAIDLISKYGQEHLQLSREDAGFMTFEDIKNLRTGQINEDILAHIINLRKTNILENQVAKLPSFICSTDDFLGFEQEESSVNFITQSKAIAELSFIQASSTECLDGKLVAIPNADPGFDWLFSHKIAGLITQYGGANSHMAIRCAEFGIPAAIGVGDKVYEGLRAGKAILDCHQERLENV